VSASKVDADMLLFLLFLGRVGLGGACLAWLALCGVSMG
jgi:hypothetical protein